MKTTSEQTSDRVFVVLVVIALGLLALIVSPFATAFFLAAVLGGALMPLQDRLAKLFKERRSLAAGVICVTVVLVLVLPVGGIAAFIVKEAASGYRYLSETLQSEGVSGLMRALPDRLEGAARQLMDRFAVEETEVSEKLSEQVGAQSGKAAKAVTGALSATGTFVVQAVMMLIALFFLLVDGGRLVSWLEEIAPLRPGQTREILYEFRRVSVAVIISTVATAAVQAIAALIGYFIARVPHPLFFGTVTFFVALVPAIGAAGVCLAAAGLLFATGHPWSALFLAIWGVVVVGLVDNVVKPLLVKRGLDLHGAVVFFALLGGLAVFGAIGLLLGPLIVSFFLALVRIRKLEDKGAS